MTPRSPELSAEQIAIQERRKAKKQKQTHLTPQVDDRGKIVERAWMKCSEGDDTHEGFRVKLLTWNLLAQCLVRRELFPVSDCLKVAQREHMIYRELMSQDADILCLQEVDRLEKVLPVLDAASYSHHYAAGPKKKHGCLIAFKTSLYSKVGDRKVEYDHEEVRDDVEGIGRKGASFRTKNIGSIVALKSTTDENRGVVVATTHLFWHPRYTYERARQAGILKREVLKFRTERALQKWPCIIAGDFNFAPDDAAYSLLVGDPLLPAQKEMITNSHVVHATIDPIVSPTKDATEEDEALDPDKVITNARSATPADGLLSPSELISLFALHKPLLSAYDQGLRNIRRSSTSSTFATFGDRITPDPMRLGAHEPKWTSYTHYWKTVLDYIFIIEPEEGRSLITELLSPHRTADLDPGIPRKGICGSDHVSLCAQIEFVPT
ncbi:Endonuclease/exonuclease/phosphatase [Desarmillaria ectypa]|nr:Endonuclease/exonuclease/phosphatase [Desarmillaria ectypa]